MEIGGCHGVIADYNEVDAIGTSGCYELAISAGCTVVAVFIEASKTTSAIDEKLEVGLVQNQNHHLFPIGFNIPTYHSSFTGGNGVTA